MKVVRELLPKAHVATVYAKPLGRPLVDTFITEVSQDTWIYFPWDMGLAFQPPIAKDGAPWRPVAAPAGRGTSRATAQQFCAGPGPSGSSCAKTVKEGVSRADVAEQVDARDLKSLGRKAVRVRPPPSAP